MEEEKLQCGECGFLSDTVCKAEEHAEDYCHTNFFLSEQAVIDQHCCSCTTYCNSQMALELHRKRSGHTEYEETEAKLRREKAEEDRRIEEWVARVQEELKNSMEKVNISFIYASLASGASRLSRQRLLHKQSQMRSCLDVMKQSLKFVDQEQAALNTLVTIVKNVAEQPAEEKFRKIRISKIEERLCFVEAGFKFLKLCKFEIEEGGEFLFLPHFEVEEELLKAANDELKRALSSMEE
ncbi:hypothetical protein DCAR_0933868 [Daucus carota subsp. sativus]|uniref:PUB domain-containing protein n=1 Tax=Daucus carota subsp. sativus TaxID=79200 RepID=A0AAF0XWX9_DAUCS|nr:hypothetical protein DCAR_0933868 [Daucus carota subsp. sativus]